LACFAYLESAGLAINRRNVAPDFLVSGNGINLAIEATTANPPMGRSKNISLLRMKAFSSEELATKTNGEFPQRMIRVLRSKLKKATTLCRNVEINLWYSWSHHFLNLALYFIRMKA
jgi:hypothetical protein